MKSRDENKYRSVRDIFPVLCLFLITGIACSGDKKQGLIPEKTFEAILTEIHLSDGLLMLPDLRELYFERDSVANYRDVVENHGYTKEAMDKTLKYYFTEKPKKLLRIYDHAIGRLTEIETLLSGEPDETPGRPGDLWKGASVYYLSDKPEDEKIYFDHVGFLQGEYALTYTATVYPADETFNPCFTAWSAAADSADTGKRNYLPPVRYIKDGQPHTYTFTFYNPGSTPVIMKGWLFDFENNPAGISKHAKIENISFLFTTRII